MNIFIRYYKKHKIISLSVIGLLIYLSYTLIPSGYGVVYNRIDRKPIGEVWVTIKYRGDTVWSIIPGGHGGTYVCIDGDVSYSDEKGRFIIPDLPFYKSIQYINESIQITGYYPGMDDIKSIYPQDISKYGTDLFLIKDNSSADERLEYLAEFAEKSLCGKSAWNKKSLLYYQAMYDEARLLNRYAKSAYSKHYVNRICNVAIGVRRNEPRGDICPWPAF